MKIRKGFVTNSSSYSSLCITIRSKKLVELFSKYPCFNSLIDKDGNMLNIDDSFGDSSPKLSIESKEDLIKEFVNSFYNLMEVYTLYDEEEDEIDFYEIEDSINRLIDEIDDNFHYIVDDVTYIEYIYNDSFSGENLYDYEELFKKLHPNDNINDYFQGTYRESYEFEIIEGQPVEEKDYDLRYENENGFLLKPSPSQLIDQEKTSEIISNNIEKIEKDIQEEHTVNESVTSEKIVFAATGTFEKFTRKTLKNFIEEKGHSLLDKISKNANYLINNDITSESSKNKFAKENNIPIITEKDLIKLLSPNLNEVSDTTQREPSTEAKSNPVVIETITKTDDFGLYIDRFLDASGIKKSDVEKITEKSKKVLLLSEDGLTVRKIRKDNKNNIIVISEGVETIAKEAFKENDVVEYLLLPKSLKMIENYAFSKCTKLTYVGVPNIELSFGSHTFSGCKSLKKIDLPDDAILGESTFEHTGLESVICKSKYNRIPRRCFSEIESLKEVVIENNIKDIATQAFSGCTQLKTIHIPTSVEKMGEDVFDTCLELKITSEHSLKPVGWNEHWNPMYRPIAWGYIKDSGKDPVYKQEAKPPKIIYIVALRFGGANVQIIHTEDNVEVKDKVCIKGTSRCGEVLIKKPASSQRYTRENKKLVELKKV